MRADDVNAPAVGAVVYLHHRLRKMEKAPAAAEPSVQP
jgi:hypothetical protein